MPTLLTRTLRAASRPAGGPLDVLCVPTHERYETNLALTGHTFWALQGPGLKGWNRTFAPVPDNYTILEDGKGPPADVGIDVVLCQTRWNQFDIGRQYAGRYGCPLVALEHVLPPTTAGAGGVREKRGDLNVFISDYSRREWGFEGEDAVVVEHGVDAELFRPEPAYHRRGRVLAVVNDFVRRDAEVGYRFWREATDGLPTLVVGDTPGLSSPARTTADLALAYQTSLIFASTAARSPVPTVLLEAMACGCCVVTTRNPMIEDFVVDGVNGFICDDPGLMRHRILCLLDHPGVAEDVGRKARRTVVERFSLGRFVEDWNRLFGRAAGLAI